LDWDKQRNLFSAPKEKTIYSELPSCFRTSVPLLQNLMGQILDECFGNLEKCWWENGDEKPFHPSLITLAEKLGFNVERFQKITGPSTSAARS
jgi:hypothetical protein